MRTRRVLVSWIGHADLQALAGSLPADQRGEILDGLKSARPAMGEVGPLKCLLDLERFDEVHLLSNYGPRKDRRYAEWVGTQLAAEVARRNQGWVGTLNTGEPWSRFQEGAA